MRDEVVRLREEKRVLLKALRLAPQWYQEARAALAKAEAELASTRDQLEKSEALASLTHALPFFPHLSQAQLFSSATPYSQLFESESMLHPMCPMYNQLIISTRVCSHSRRSSYARRRPTGRRSTASSRKPAAMQRGGLQPQLHQLHQQL